MTANQLLCKLNEIISQLSTGDIHIKNLDRELDINFELAEKNGEYYIDTMLKIEYDK